MNTSTIWLKSVHHKLSCVIARSYADLPQKAIAVFTGERGVNNVTLLGRVGRQPHIRGTDEKNVTVFSLATSQSFKTPDGNFFQKTEWHRVSVFRPVLKDIVAATVKKGDRLFVSGMITYGRYTDKKTNEQMYTTNIIADNVINMSKSMGGGGGGAGTASSFGESSDDVMDYEEEEAPRTHV